mmetsp:Transcript_18256/g.25662  ORF Transcript_18256/g.25662 Transcript_18256/m.25662 type:complete len:135 (+) Transcript_18256:421-825(+)
MFIGTRISPDFGRKLSKLDIPKSMCVPAVRVSTTTLFLNLVERVEQNFVNDRISEKLTKRKVYQEGDETRQGLGRLPMNLPSVDSMLLFNSDENPYQNYSTFDNLLSSLLKKEKTRVTFIIFTKLLIDKYYVIF